MLKDTIVFYRKKRGLSQEELANLLFVSRQTVSQWEKGQTLPTIDNLQRLKEIFGVGFDDLLNESASAAAEEAESGSAEQSAPQTAEAGTPCADHSRQSPFDADAARERFAYTLNDAQIKRGTRNGWTAYWLSALLPVSFPLYISITEMNRALIGAIALWIALLIVLYSVRWSRRRAKLTETLGSRETEIRVYQDHLTQKNIKDGETVSMFQMRFNEIRRADDLGTLFRITDGEKVLLIPKDAVSADGILHHRLEEKIKTGRERINPGVASLLIIGAILVDYAISRIYLSLIGPEESIANAQAYSWIWLFGLLLPLICAGYGIIKARRRKKGAAALIIIGLICILFASSQMLLPGILNETTSDVNSEISQIEEDVKISLPKYSNIHITKNVMATGKKRVTQVLWMNMERSVSLAFDTEIANEPRWIKAAQAERLSPVWNPSYAAENADYVMCVNLTDGVANDLPAHDGIYRFINLLYIRETESLYIVRYEVDYRQE